MINLIKLNILLKMKIFTTITSISNMTKMIYFIKKKGKEEGQENKFTGSIQFIVAAKYT